jgi:hypothetical protein
MTDGATVAALIGLSGALYSASTDHRPQDPAARETVLRSTAALGLATGAVYALSMFYGRDATSACEREIADIWPPRPRR